MLGSSYAISWRDHGTPFVGRARLDVLGLRLEGRDGAGHETLRTVPYAEIAGVDVRRTPEGRGLVVALLRGGALTIRSLDRPGILSELAAALQRLADSPQR